MASLPRRRAEPELGETANGTPIKIPTIMKTAIYEKLRQDGFYVHRCAPGSDGICYYLVSERHDRDYEDKDGRIFRAFRETTMGDLEIGATLGFYVSGTAQAAQRSRVLMGDFDAFVAKAGVARLRALLNGDLSEAPHVDVELNSDSPDEDFTLPPEPDLLVEQRELRLQIPRILAELHGAGKKRVTKNELLNHLCTDIRVVDRVLNILAERKIVNGALTNSMKLTTAGYLEAEKTIAPPVPPADSQPLPDQVDVAETDEAVPDLAKSELPPLRARPEDRVPLSGVVLPVTPEQFEPSREALEKLIEEWGAFYPQDNAPDDPGNKTEIPIVKDTYDLVLALAEASLALHRAPGLPPETRGLFEKTLEVLKSLRETLEAAKGAADEFKSVLAALGAAIVALEGLIRLFF